MLSNMNHPDGNCPLCLYLLVDEAAGDNLLPFMKLMSCFHCFHCECIIRWWNWLQMHNETDANTPASMSSLRDMEEQQGRHDVTEENMGRCPVCRKLFLAKDIEHVLRLVGTHSEVSSSETEFLDEDNLLHSDSEKIRRHKFENIFKLQQENSGLIEAKRHEVLLPGMFLPRSSAPPSTMSDKETYEPENENPAVSSRAIPRGSSTRTSTSKHRNSSGRKHAQRGRNSEKHVRQWIRKENGAGS